MRFVETFEEPAAAAPAAPVAADDAAAEAPAAPATDAQPADPAADAGAAAKAVVAAVEADSAGAKPKAPVTAADADKVSPEDAVPDPAAAAAKAKEGGDAAGPAVASQAEADKLSAVIQKVEEERRVDPDADLTEDQAAAKLRTETEALAKKGDRMTNQKELDKLMTEKEARVIEVKEAKANDEPVPKPADPKLDEKLDE